MYKKRLSAALALIALPWQLLANTPTSDICDIQQRLLQADYQPGWIVWLTQTQPSDSIKHFQQEQDLAETGQLDDATVERLIDLSLWGETEHPLFDTANISEAPLLDADGCIQTPEPSQTTEISNATVATGVVIEEIIVTGEKVGRSLQETATAVAVHTAEDIEDQGDSNIADILNRTGNTSSSVEGKLSIRGISAGTRDGSPLISVVVDGSTQDITSLQGASTQMFDVAQVEVLRGAQSTSQGRNALAGAVIINTQDPTWDWETKIQANAEQRNGKNLAIAFGGPLSENFAFRLVGQNQSTDGYVTHTPTGNEAFAREESNLLRGKLLFAPSDSRYKSMLTISHNDTYGHPDYHMEKGEAGSDPEVRRTSTVNEPSFNDINTLNAAWLNEFEFNEHYTLVATTSAMDTDQLYFRDFDGTDEDGGSNPAWNDGRNWSQEVRLNIDFPGKVKGLFGLYGGRFDNNFYYESNGVRANVNDAGIPGGPVGEAIEVEIDFFTRQEKSARNAAAFAEFDIELPWDTTATLGLRYDRETLDAYDETDTTRGDAYLNLGGAFTPIPLVGEQLASVFDQIRENSPGLDVREVLIAGGIAPTTNGIQGGRTTYEALLPKVGLRHMINEEWTVFTTYVEAYRAGGVSVDTSNGETLPYDPEYTSNYEIGARGDLFDLGIQLGINLFYTEWEDQQVRVLRNQFYVTENAASSELYGADFSLGWQATDALRLHTSLGWVHTEYLEYQDSGNDHSGNEFVLAPPFTASIGGTYRNGRLMLSGTLSHQDKAYVSPANNENEVAEERQLLNARIGWEEESLSVYVYGRNLLDQDYIAETFQFPDGYVGAPSARGYAAYGEPMTLGVQVNFQY